MTSPIRSERRIVPPAAPAAASTPTYVPPKYEDPTKWSAQGKLLVVITILVIAGVAAGAMIWMAPSAQPIAQAPAPTPAPAAASTPNAIVASDKQPTGRTVGGWVGV